MTARVFVVVEGHGDVSAYPILLRRIAGEVCGAYDVEVEKPYRLPKDKISRAEDITPILEFGLARLNERSSPGDRKLILVTRDSDGNCPVDIATAITAVALQTQAADITKVVVADEEFESWLLAGAEALRQHKDCRTDFDVANDTDAQHSPKGRFEQIILKEGRSYSETVDQPKFSAVISLDQEARDKSRSLRKLVSTIEQFLQ